MQTRDQVKNWKVVVSSASVAALGLTGIAVANADGSNIAPPAINVNDQSDRVAHLTTTTTSFEVVPGPVTQFDSIDSIDDSLLASATIGDSVDDSADPAVVDDSIDDSQDAAVVDDSPDDSPDTSPDDSDSLDSSDSSD
jgi:hypothetical protein